MVDVFIQERVLSYDLLEKLQKHDCVVFSVSRDNAVSAMISGNIIAAIIPREE